MAQLHLLREMQDRERERERRGHKRASSKKAQRQVHLLSRTQQQSGSLFPFARVTTHTLTQQHNSRLPSLSLSLSAARHAAVKRSLMPPSLSLTFILAACIS